MPDVYQVKNGKPEHIFGTQTTQRIEQLEQKTKAATVNSLGLVQPDGKTVLIDKNGVISAVASGSATATIPTITGPDTAPIGFATTYSFTSSSGLQGGQILSFDVTFNGQTRNVTATDGAGSIDITVPAGTAENTALELSVVANDNYGGQSKPNVKTITAVAAYVESPTITLPASGATVSPTSIAITTSAFSTAGASDSHSKSRYKITSDVAGENIVFDSGEVASLTSYTAKPADLTPGSTCYVFAQHIGTRLGASYWSPGVAVVIAKALTPSITAPAASAYVSPASVTITTSPFAAENSVSDTLAASYYKICTDQAGNSPVYESGRISGTAVSHTASLSTKLTPGSTYYVFARHEGTNTGLSAWSTGVAIKASNALPPSITAPVVGAEIMVTEGVTIVTGAFSTAGGIADTHASTDWKITSDAAGQQVVAEAAASSDLLTHTFTGLELTEGNTYYAWARHNGTVTGASAWSTGRSFVAKKGVTAPSGRVFYRHSSGMGTVMEFNDGQARKAVILDAKYRTKAQFGTYGKDSSLTNYQSQNKNDTWYINGGSAATTPDACKTLTDAFLNDMWATSKDQNAAKQNDDVWLTYEGTTDSQSISGVPAVRAAREVKVNGVGCDIPNHQTLMRMYCDADIIDSLDPTVAAYPGNALGSANTNGAWKIAGANSAFASTEYGSNYVRCVHYNGYCLNATKGLTCAVAPVLEI